MLAFRAIRAPLTLSAALLAGCVTHPAARYQVPSAPVLQANSDSTRIHVPLRYVKDPVHLDAYTRIVFDPVAVYEGPEADFGKLSDEDKVDIASLVQTEFRSALQPRFTLDANQPGKALRVQITLVAVETSTPVVSTVSKIVPFGLVANTVNAVRDRQALFTGSIAYVVEVYDQKSNDLLIAYVAREYPNAMSLASSVHILDAARSGVRKGAHRLQVVLTSPEPSP